MSIILQRWEEYYSGWRVDGSFVDENPVISVFVSCSLYGGVFLRLFLLRVMVEIRRDLGRESCNG
jgi:hypothetical protein